MFRAGEKKSVRAAGRTWSATGERWDIDPVGAVDLETHGLHGMGRRDHSDWVPRIYVSYSSGLGQSAQACIKLTTVIRERVTKECTTATGLLNREQSETSHPIPLYCVVYDHR